MTATTQCADAAAPRSSRTSSGCRCAARPRGTLGHLDPALARSESSPLVRAFPGASRGLRPRPTTAPAPRGTAAPQFPAASTLKLAIAVETLRSLHGKPAPWLVRRQPSAPRAHLLGQRRRKRPRGALRGLDERRQRPGEHADAKPRPRGHGDVRRLRARTAAAPIPAAWTSSRTTGSGSTRALTTSRSFRLRPLATAGKGPLAKRYRLSLHALRMRAISSISSRTQRTTASSTASCGARRWVMHKAGWITSARHDAGLVYWRGGVFAVGRDDVRGGVGTASDILAGRVAYRTLGVLPQAAATLDLAAAGAVS